MVTPAMPAFYTHPQSVEEMVDFVAGRVLDLCGIDNALLPRWGSA
jgi:4-hydroxy-3-polyprenylbenzoate decarboxylase